MGFSLPPFAASVAERVMQRAGTSALSEAEKAGALASRLEQLTAKPALSAAEKVEQKELQKAVGELESVGWKPKAEGKAPDTHQSSFSESKGKKPSEVRNLIDGVQDWVDGATLAGGVAGAALTAGVVTAPAGVAATVVSDVASLVSAGVDVVQAGVAAAQGDYAGAGAQLLQAGGRALGAIPYVGTALRGAKQVGKAGLVAAEVAEKVAVKTAAKKLAPELSEAAVKTFVKETAEHPAFSDLVYSMGKQFKGATLETVADPAGAKEIAKLAERIRSGDVAGTTLTRYAHGEAGVNDFLHDVVARFSKGGGAKLGGEAAAELGADTARVLGKAGAPLSEAVSKALAGGKLATKDLDTLKKAASVLDETGNAVVRDGIAAAMNKALEGPVPGKALAELVEKAQVLEKAAVKSGGTSSSLATALSRSSGNALEFRQAYEALLDVRISPKGLQASLTPEVLGKLTDKAGLNRLVSEARRLSI